MGCGGDNNVVGDAVDATAASELVQLDAALENMDKAMVATMKSFNDLVIAMDKVTHIYSNLAVVCSQDVKDRLKTFDTETRAMQEKGLYSNFNADVHSGSIACFDGLKKEVKTARKTLETTKKAQVEYEARRKKIEQKEADFAKKGKQVSTDKDYQKNVKERDQKKTAYETEKKKFDSQMQSIRTKMNQTVIKSSSNYCNCVVAFCTYMTKVVEVFGDSQKTPKLTSMINGYKAPTLKPLEELNKAAAAPAAAAPAESKAEGSAPAPALSA